MSLILSAALEGQALCTHRVVNVLFPKYNAHRKNYSFDVISKILCFLMSQIDFLYMKQIFCFHKGIINPFSRYNFLWHYKHCSAFHSIKFSVFDVIKKSFQLSLLQFTHDTSVLLYFGLCGLCSMSGPIFLPFLPKIMKNHKKYEFIKIIICDYNSVICIVSCDYRTQ